MLPDGAARARELGARGRRGGGPRAPLVASYVRVAVGPGAQERLDAMEGRYRTLTPGQVAHFAALDVPLGTVGVAAATAAAVQPDARAYDPALDLRSRACSRSRTQARSPRSPRPPRRRPR